MKIVPESIDTPYQGCMITEVKLWCCKSMCSEKKKQLHSIRLIIWIFIIGFGGNEVVIKEVEKVFKGRSVCRLFVPAFEHHFVHGIRTSCRFGLAIATIYLFQNLPVLHTWERIYNTDVMLLLMHIHIHVNIFSFLLSSVYICIKDLKCTNMYRYDQKNKTYLIRIRLMYTLFYKVLTDVGAVF